MHAELHLVVAAALVGLGIGSALSRRNIIAIIMAIVTSGSGAILAMAALSHRGGGDALLFALVLGAVLLALVATGCALAYRRHLSQETAEIDAGNELRH